MLIETTCRSRGLLAALISPAMLAMLAMLGLLLVASSTPLPAGETATAAEAEPTPGRILVVVTNHGRIPELDKPTGYWLAEVAHPWAVFVDAGYAVDFASPDGGFAPMDPRSFDLDDETNRRFWHELGAVEGLLHNHPLGELDGRDYAAVYFAGGHGTMWDFPDSEPIARFTRSVWEHGGVVAAVCHGPAALVGVTLADGSRLVDGRKLTAFSVSEEQAVDLAEAVPFFLTERLREQGAEVLTADDFETQVVTDGRLVTGQNPASAEAAGQRIVELLATEEPAGD